MKRLRVFLLLTGWDASPFQGTPSIRFAGTRLYNSVESGIVRVTCLTQEHNTMSSVRARTQTARSIEERSKHGDPVPRTRSILRKLFTQKTKFIHEVLPVKRKIIIAMTNVYPKYKKVEAVPVIVKLMTKTWTEYKKKYTAVQPPVKNERHHQR